MESVDIDMGKYPEYDILGMDKLIEMYNEYDELSDEDFDLLSPDTKERFKYIEELTANAREADLSKEWEENQAKVHTVGDDDLTTKGPVPKFSGLFGDRYLEYKETTDLFDYLALEDECNDPNFIKWLMDKKAFSVEKVASESNMIFDYRFEYYGYGEGGAKPFRRFETDRLHMEASKHITAITEIREYYDQWKKERLNKRLKKAGVATFIGVSLVSLITGLSLGLKRKGKDLIRNSRWSKLSSSYKETPWTDLEKATGEGLVVIGDYIYLVIGGVCVGVYFYKKK